MNQLAVVGCQIRVAKPTLVEITRIVRFDEKPRSRNQSIKQFSTFVAFEVESDASFIAVVCPPVNRAIGICSIFKKGRQLPSPRPARWLNLDDVRAQIAQDLATEETSLGSQIEHSVWI